MADTGILTFTPKPVIGDIKRFDFDWISDGSGDVELAINSKMNGFILALVTDPGAAAPTTLYDITIEDDKGVDILGGVGADRSATAVEAVAVPLDSGLPRPISTDSFTFKVTNAGDTKAGLVQIFMK